MKTWLEKFWSAHGDRLIFASLATIFGFVFYYLMPDMKGEAKTILIGVAMLLYNKSRSTSTDVQK